LPVGIARTPADDFLTQVRALVLAIDPDIGSPPDPTVVRDLLGLTLAEARVAQPHMRLPFLSMGEIAMWKRHAIGIAACVALLAQQGAASAQQRQDLDSANHVMVGCRAFVNNADHTYYLQGSCAGRVATIHYFGASRLGVCMPDGVNVGQAVRVVVAYIDARPARMHERFELLAAEALHQAWSCRT
jgi:hypothetical protein